MTVSDGDFCSERNAICYRGRRHDGPLDVTQGGGILASSTSLHTDGSMRTVAIISALVALSGCSSYSSNLQVGNDQSYLSLKDQREAVRLVRVYDALPDGAEIIGEVSAGRCHRSFVEQAPSEATVVTDLKIAAYAQGADGITNINVSKDSGLNRNCWYVLGGTAKAFMLKQ